jgi:hypothetical protein
MILEAIGLTFIGLFTILVIWILLSSMANICGVDTWDIVFFLAMSFGILFGAYGIGVVVVILFGGQLV